jgi:hypothetical protein
MESHTEVINKRLVDSGDDVLNTLSGNLTSDAPISTCWLNLWGSQILFSMC